jgi:hypothetical protein
MDRWRCKGIGAWCFFDWGYALTSKIIESLREDLVSPLDSDAISEITVRRFDALYPVSARQLSTGDSKRLRKARKSRALPRPRGRLTES